MKYNIIVLDTSGLTSGSRNIVIQLNAYARDGWFLVSTFQLEGKVYGIFAHKV